MFEPIGQQRNTFVQQLDDVIQRHVVHDNNVVVVIVIIIISNIAVIDRDVRSASVVLGMLSTSNWSRTRHSPVRIRVQVEALLIERTRSFATIEVFAVLLAASQHSRSTTKTCQIYASAITAGVGMAISRLIFIYTNASTTSLPS